MAFNTGLSGLRAATSDLNVTGNNIANAGTAGFKSSRAEFADVYAASVVGSGSNPIGSGVALAGVSQNFKTGPVNYTQNPLDLAINGNGFFRVSNGGDVSYTRAGFFRTDRQGYIENNFHHRLQGYPVDANGNLQTGVVGDLRIDASSQAPRATGELNQQLSLNSNRTVPPAWQGAYDASIASAADPTNPTAAEIAAARAAANATFAPSDSTTYNDSTSVNVYDTQGNAHVLTQYFVKTGANTWQMNVLIDGRNPADPTSTVPYSMTVGFNTNGQLDGSTLVSGDYDGDATPDFAVDPATGRFTLNGWVPAAADSSTPPVWSPNGAVANAGGIRIDLRGTSQTNNAFAVTGVNQDGYTTGQLAGLEVDDSGVIFARYTNGQSRVQGQVVLASFANMQGLTPVGKTAWVQSFQSGDPVIGTPSSGTLGALQSGALEDSNVELSDQLVNLIIAQRNYQANAKTIETESAVTQTIINLR